jgi:hypothetical protein
MANGKNLLHTSWNWLKDPDNYIKLIISAVVIIVALILTGSHFSSVFLIKSLLNNCRLKDYINLLSYLLI